MAPFLREGEGVLGRSVFFDQFRGNKDKVADVVGSSPLLAQHIVNYVVGLRKHGKGENQ
jgi:hypothetical protein